METQYLNDIGYSWIPDMRLVMLAIQLIMQRYVGKAL